MVFSFHLGFVSSSYYVIYIKKVHNYEEYDEALNTSSSYVFPTIRDKSKYQNNVINNVERFTPHQRFFTRFGILICSLIANIYNESSVVIYYKLFIVYLFKSYKSVFLCPGLFKSNISLVANLEVRGKVLSFEYVV